MAETVRLETPRVRVVMDDGRELIVQVRNPDYIVWDRTASKHGWPKMADAPLTWLTFVAWAALRREGQINGEMTWEAFSETHAWAVSTVKADGTPTDDDDDTLPEGVVPTLPGRGPG